MSAKVVTCFQKEVILLTNPFYFNAIGRLRKTGSDRIATACGAVIVSRPDLGNFKTYTMSVARNILNHVKLVPGEGVTKLNVSDTLGRRGEIAHQLKALIRQMVRISRIG